MVKNIYYTLLPNDIKEKIKEILIRELIKWVTNVWKEIKKDPIQKLTIIFISPFLIHAFAEVLVDFSLFTEIGYYIGCIYGFSKILDDPYRIIRWGGGYAIGASITPLIFSSIWPQIQEGTYSSIFTTIIISYVFIMIFLKVRELKKVNPKILLFGIFCFAKNRLADYPSFRWEEYNRN